jgi:putative FmdB family regulatory protein
LTPAGRTARISVDNAFDGEGVMPQYNFLCRACKKEFSKILTIAEHEKDKTACPHCKSKDVEQRWAAFYAVTSKKS